MPISNISAQKQKNQLISPPDWADEARVPYRALWEVAAMAGDLDPKLKKLKEKKEADTKWTDEYEDRVAAIKNALLPTRNPSPDHVYYNPKMAGNAALIRNPKKFRLVRVEVVNAIEFLWHRFGKDAFAEGLQVVHQKLSTQRACTVNQIAQDLINDPIASAENFDAIKSPSHRDQKLANATKELKRLQVLLYIFSRELYGFGKDSKHSAESVTSDWLNSIEEAGFKGREGFGPDGVQTLIEKCFKSYSELK